MDNVYRAMLIREALATIDNALATMEKASYEDMSDDGDDLWWAVNNYNEAHHKALETPSYNYKEERVPSHKEAILNAVKAIKEG